MDASTEKPDRMGVQASDDQQRGTVTALSMEVSRKRHGHPREMRVPAEAGEEVNRRVEQLPFSCPPFLPVLSLTTPAQRPEGKGTPAMQIMVGKVRRWASGAYREADWSTGPPWRK